MSKITSYHDLQPIYNQELALSYLKTIQEFLKNKVTQAKADGVIVGISGGIDSALVYAIAKQTFGANVLGVTMPVIKMTDSDLQHINQLETAFGDKFQKVDLTKTFEALSSTLGISNSLAVANIKPRLRMTTLYALAQERNYLVLGTDNADEVYIGYFTKFGDGGADLLPICHLTKGEVRYLASLLGVPKSIINKDPSAGLWEGQTDESELGFSYNQLDFYLNHKTNNELCIQILGADVVAKIQAKHLATQHKRDPIYQPEKLN